jgi:transcription-repair coupling factor (superfamily II helicase)
MGINNITGVTDSRVAYVCAEILKNNEGQCLIVAPSFIHAKRLVADLSFFVNEKIYLMPSDEETLIHFEAKNRDTLLERINILAALTSGEPCVIVAPANQVIKKLPPREFFISNVQTLKVSTDLERDTLAKSLVYMGYERVPMVYAKGQFCIRGGLLDIFPPDRDMPVRVEFFDTEIETIRSFDPETQRSGRVLTEVRIVPAELIIGDDDNFQQAEKSIRHRYKNLLERQNELAEAIQTRSNLQLLESYMDDFYDAPEQLIDYMSQGIVIIEDPNKCLETVERYTHTFHRDFEIFLEKGQVVPSDLARFPGRKEYLELYRKNHLFLISPYSVMPKEVGSLETTRNITSRQGISFNGKLDLLEREIHKSLEEGYKITIVCSSDDRKSNMEDFLHREGLAKRVWVKSGVLTSGMVFPEEKICIITDGDIFGNQKYRRKGFRGNVKGQPIKSFTDISQGDFVVHDSHGIGKFIGIEQLTVQGMIKDYMKVEYAGNDTLYVPVDQMNLIQKYMGADAVTPKINRLAGNEWKNTRAKAKVAIENMARELLEISAARQARGGYQFGPDTVWQREFEDSFPFEETDDQLQCIEEIKLDMERPIAMDRLLCGDVGYGKTEVAARAMFKCAAEGKQVALLVPTTILASQHYHTLKDRFEKFPFTVEMLSRFKTEAQQTQILAKLKTGTVDIVIGTHRLLSQDVAFKDLGLLIIDEEQRFGVQHKEAIKKLRENVDVLTLSATPIPRTLHMSLLGIRDMSLIEEPPEERYPVQTYVLEQDDYVISEAIQREMDRGGQVFVICNRISGIYRVAEHINKLVPGREILVGHGRLNEHALEDVMMNFMAGNGDILIATTIIENGIDIPNVNTVVILDADKFGLSQLYQLRGRVGRSNRLAYAYLMHRKDKVLSEVADKRLRAIREFTEFGAGFKIAMRDLEIRGAGNLLGTEQHGHIVNIGYELYCKLVEQAVRGLQGEYIPTKMVETVVDIRVEAYIPPTYIEDEVLKLEMYKKISAVSSRQNMEEIRSELIDRFGEIPEETENLIRISLIQSLGQTLGMKRVTRHGGKTLDQMIDLLMLVKENESMI